MTAKRMSPAALVAGVPKPVAVYGVATDPPAAGAKAAALKAAFVGAIDEPDMAAIAVTLKTHAKLGNIRAIDLLIRILSTVETPSPVAPAPTCPPAPVTVRNPPRRPARTAALRAEDVCVRVAGVLSDRGPLRMAAVQSLTGLGYDAVRTALARAEWFVADDGLWSVTPAGRAMVLLGTGEGD